MQLAYDGKYKDNFTHLQNLFQVYRSQITLIKKRMKNTE